jgi:CRP/FNR family cyclic AMP-dependent transcriptional regulator
VSIIDQNPAGRIGYSVARNRSVNSLTLQMIPKAKQPFNPKAFLAKLGKGKTHADYGKNHNVFSQGDVAEHIFYLQKGKVKLTVVSRQGKQVVVAVLGAGDFFGEGCMAGQSLRMATACTVSDCSIVRLEKLSAIRVLRDEQGFSGFFLRYLLSRNIRIEEDLVDQLFNSCEKRLARVLLLLAKFGKEDKPELVIPKISEATLAEIVGIPPAQVNALMKKFRKLGFIGDNGGLEVHSSLLNVVLHD